MEEWQHNESKPRTIEEARVLMRQRMAKIKAGLLEWEKQLTEEDTPKQSSTTLVVRPVRTSEKIEMSL